MIFQTYFNNKDLTIENIDDDSAEVGAHFQSDISRLSVKLFEFENPIKLIIKEPTQRFLQKLYFKLLKPFMRETFWYMEAIPSLKTLYPEVDEISAKCFHAITAYQDNYGYVSNMS